MVCCWWALCWRQLVLSPQRWQLLLRLPLLVLPVLMFQLGPSIAALDLDPEPFRWADQGAYLWGSCCSWPWPGCGKRCNSRWHRIVAGISTALAGVMVWQTGSRAAFLAAALAVALLWLQRGVGFELHLGEAWLSWVFVPLALAAKQLLRPSAPGFLESISVLIPVGWRLPAVTARFPSAATTASSMASVSTVVERFALTPSMAVWLITPTTSICSSLRALGCWAFGLVLLLGLLVLAWRSAAPGMDAFPRVAGQLVLLYTLIQGFLDLSLLHWPVTLVFTGVLLGIPLSWHRSAGNSSRKFSLTT